MAETIVAHSNPMTVKRWANSLFIEQVSKSYWERRFIGDDDNKVVQRRTELEGKAGDTISYDLSAQLRGDVTYGDDRLEGKEEQLRFYSDEVRIDQVRKAVSTGGKMTKQRTVHNLRMVARERAATYWAQFFDEVIFCYLSAARGINQDYVVPLGFTGFAGNAFDAPDASHIMYGGSATSKATITNTDKMSLTAIEKAEVKARMLRAKDPESSNMMPIEINGEKHYVLLMSPFQEHDLRTASGGATWLDIQKAAAAAEGRNNPIFKGGLGMHKNVVLHSHERVVRFSDYGAGTNLAAARALFLGRQAGVIAYAKGGNTTRFNWEEEWKDFKNELAVASGTIVGVKKARFNSKDFGVISLDTYATDPNA